MIRISALALALALSIFGIGGLAAQIPGETARDGLKRPRLSPALDLLPAGSNLEQVVIPRYDEERRRTALIRAEVLQVVTEELVTGDKIELRLFSKEGAETLRLETGAAEYSLKTGVIEAKKIITVNGDGFKGQGEGGSFLLDSRQGILQGRVTTSFFPKPEEKEPEQLAPQPEAPAGPPPMAVVVPDYIEPLPLTLEQLEQLEAVSQPQRGVVLADRAPTRELLIRSRQLSQAADVSLRSFVHKVGRPEFLTTARPGTTSPVPPQDHPRPEEGVHISCEGGMYVDAQKGYLAYLRDIVVREKRFTMTCTDQLKVFFDMSEGIDNISPENAQSLAVVKTIVAIGGISVIRPDPEGKAEPIIASAEYATIDVETGDIVLQGGTPTIRQGSNFLQAGEPNLYLRFYENGNIFAEKGRWITGGDLAEFSTDKEDEKKEKASVPDGAPANPATDPKEPEPEAPRRISVTCTGGIFVDAVKGHVIYLENVEVTEPRVRMTCDDELKIILEPKPPKEKKKGEQESPAGLDAFGDVKAMVATGNVTVTAIDPEGERRPVTATASVASYDGKSGGVILRGGTPAIREEGNSLVAGEPNLYLRFYENGSFFAEKGKWTTKGDLANLRKKPGEKLEPPRILQITSQRGLQFDSVVGQIVYRGGIEIVEPRFRMSCAGEMTIYLTKKENAERDRLEGPEAFSDVKGLVAGGGVRVVRKDPRGKADPVVATADTAAYEAKSGDFVLRGGYPTVRQGTNSLRAAERGLYLRFYQNGNFYAPRGNWITDGNIKELRKGQE